MVTAIQRSENSARVKVPTCIPYQFGRVMIVKVVENRHRQYDIEGLLAIHPRRKVADSRANELPPSLMYPLSVRDVRRIQIQADIVDVFRKVVEDSPCSAADIQDPGTR